MNKTRFTTLKANVPCVTRADVTPSSMSIHIRYSTMLLFCFMTMTTVYSQSCSLHCVGHVNISLGTNCEATVTPDMLINTISTACPGGNFVVSIEDSNGVIMTSPDVNLTHVGMTLSAHVTDTNSNNSCWGSIFVEYKLAPNIQCPENDTVSCGALDVLGLPMATAQCGGGTFDVFLLDEIRVPLDCDPDYSSRITRTYRSENSFGNTAECSHTILLERIDFDGIIFPSDACIACDDPNFIFVDGIPLPFISGVIPTGSGSAGVPIICMPTTGSGTMGTPNNIGFAFAVCGSGSSGVPLIPIGGATIATPSGVDTIPSTLGQVCNSVVLYEDFPVSNNPCKRSIMRRFEVREWFCGGDSSRFGTQMIEVKDTTAPTFTCPEDFTVSSDEDCQMLVDFPPVTPTDGCGNGIIVQIDPNGSPIVNTNGGQGILMTGINQVRYIVSDSCYNSNSCMLNVTVQDQVEPIAICESNTIVALSSTGNTFLRATSLDDGSWDGCGIDRFEVRRMTTDCNQDDLMFGNEVEFCCTDAGAEVMVVFRVYDTSGNTNDCMVRVDVQDKLPSTLECPLNLNIDCRDPYDPNNLAATFGEAKLIGDCSATNLLRELTPDNQVNACGIGTITRTFNLLDDNQTTVLSSCNQLITITDSAPFNISMIQWPLDYSVSSGVCTSNEVDPEDLDPAFSFPSFIGGDDQCSMLAFNHEDTLRTVSGSGQCFRIERTWTVINWCENSGGTFTRYTDPNGPQMINVSNNVMPTTDAPDAIVAESQNIDCVSELIEFTRTGTATCGPLEWSYVLRDLGGTPMASGNSNVFSEILVAASYVIEWTISDQCNNTLVQNQPLSVVNTKAPTPVCINNMTVALDTPVDTDGDGLSDQAIKELWASDFDGGSYHSCNNPITISLSPDPTETNITFTCDSVGILTVRLYVTDNTTMAQDFCSLNVTITDGGLCDNNMRVVVEGNIYTETLDEVENVEVNLVNGELSDMTDSEGTYAFSDMPVGGSYMIEPEKDIEYLNGVSTLDIIHIQRHIIGAQKLDSPYKIIAADADNSETVTALDLIELRKLILGAYDKLPRNTSWRFVDVEQQFLDQNNPWSQEIAESYIIRKLQSDMDIDFIGVKVGDVNGSVTANANSTIIDNRSSRWPLSFAVADDRMEAGDIHRIAITSSSYERVTGWQYTLNFDPTMIEILSIESGSLMLDDSHYNLNLQDYGLLPISYNSESESDMGKDDILFELVVKVKQDVRSGELFTISSDVTAAEAYRGLSEIVNVQLVSRQKNALEIISAQPNPWKQFTDIDFVMAEEGIARWEVYDVSGQLVYKYNDTYTAGPQSIRIEKKDIKATGVLYLRLITEQGSVDYKLVSIE